MIGLTNESLPVMDFCNSWKKSNSVLNNIFCVIFNTLQLQRENYSIVVFFNNKIIF